MLQLHIYHSILGLILAVVFVVQNDFDKYKFVICVADWHNKAEQPETLT